MKPANDSPRPIGLSFVPLAAALLPLLAMHATYVISGLQGHVEWCVPYVEGCTSISRAAWRVPTVFVYRSLMVPTGVFLIFYWRFSKDWLVALRGGGGATITITQWVGGIGAACWVVFAISFGQYDRLYELQPVLLAFFVLTIIAQIMLTFQLRSVVRRRNITALRGVVMWKLIVVALLLTFGVANTLVAELVSRHRIYVDAIEWNMVLLMSLFTLASWVGWRVTEFRANPTVRVEASITAD